MCPSPILRPNRDRQGAATRAPRSSGFTLIEMMISVTLVALIIGGLLTTMRTGVTAYQKVTQRLEDNRRVMGLNQALHRQLGGLMPVLVQCPGGPSVSAFSGDPLSLRFVSSASLAEGTRGYPRVVEYVIVPDPQGGLRLMMNERIYAGPSSLVPVCANRSSVAGPAHAAIGRTGGPAGLRPPRIPETRHRFTHRSGLESGLAGNGPAAGGPN